MRVLVTGATGFLGQHVCHKLLGLGHDILGLGRNCNIESCDKNTMHFSSYRLGDPLPRSVVDFAPEVLVHLAWDGIPNFSDKKCIENVEAQIEFLRETEKLSALRRIIVSGSCREYSTKNGACHEAERCPPDSYFSWAKQTLHDYFLLACKQREIELVWFRIFYVYGKGQRAESLIPTLISTIQHDGVPDIKTPSAANDYVYIDDVTDAFIRAIEIPSIQGTFNLGTGKATPVSDIAAMVKRIVSPPKELHPERDIVNSYSAGMWADIALAERNLGWVPRISLSEGIKSMHMASGRE